MRIAGLLVLCLGLSGCRQYKVFRPHEDGLRPGNINFATKEDCEDFVKKAAVIQPETKRFCARIVE